MLKNNPSPITKIFLVRHGETLWNVEGKMQGHWDSPLTANGVAQAQALAERLKRYSFAAIYSSDLGRAYQTAQYIVEKNVPQTIFTKTCLRERCLGIFQGVAKEELERKFPEAFRLYKTRDPDYVVPNGESLRQFRQRCVACFEELANKHSGEQVLVVAHGGVLVSFFKHTLGLSLESLNYFEILNSSLNVFAYKDEHWWLSTWGDVGHLEQLKQVQALDDVS